MHCPALDCVTVRGLTRGRVGRLFGVLSSVRDLLSASRRFSAVIHLGKAGVMVLSVPPGLNARADYWRGKEMCAHTKKKKKPCRKGIFSGCTLSCESTIFCR